ncbi:MAG: VTT domain-containing protein [Planctomycetia bacterium]|nr:MAG: VTT domain-containing protein [Planctomycetia bacterium]
MPPIEQIWQFWAIVLATFASEDLTCIATGLLIYDGRIGGWTGVLACTLGIFVGDFGLWLLGRLAGPPVLRWKPVAARFSAERLGKVGEWFDRRGWRAIVAARFLPGTRFPVYVAAGALGRSAGRFLMWAGIAALLWTPALVLLVAWLGGVIADPLRAILGGYWLGLLGAVAILWILMMIGVRLSTAGGRSGLMVTLERVRRHEFWPAWVFYLPLLPWIAWLAVRHRGLMTPTAANPGIARGGGIVGESKWEILSRLPAEWVVPGALLRSDGGAGRADELASIMDERGWSFPLILKPDVGQRGAGVRLVRDLDAAQRVLANAAVAMIAQVYHPGPHEAGIFYVRRPSAARGRVFSVTDKEFPEVAGDGERTLEALIRAHPRYRLQAKTYLARLGVRAGERPAVGERVRLAVAGNHCQGTLFRDGSHLVTPALENRIDSIAREFDGFFFGRFDVRYADADELRAGRGFAVIELNGVTSESTNLYDPSWPVWRAYAVLFAQWHELYAVGAENRRRGHSVSGLLEVLREVRAHYRGRVVSTLSD